MTEEPRFFKDRAEWRRWLQKNHLKSAEIWVITYKKHTGKKCLSYEDALEEAMIHGWIDSRLRRIDDERHMWRFVPRKPNSIWSLSNRRRAERLIEEGKMTASGLATVEAGKRSGQWDKAIAPSKPPRIPSDLKQALIKDGPAWDYFRGFAKSYRTQYLYWILTAKTGKTRSKRIKQVVSWAHDNKKQPWSRGIGSAKDSSRD